MDEAQVGVVMGSRSHWLIAGRVISGRVARGRSSPVRWATGRHSTTIFRYELWDSSKRHAQPGASASVKKLAEEVIDVHSTLVLAEDTLGAARHAAGEGWIRIDALTKVGEEKRADEGRDESKVTTPDGGEPSSGAPTRVIGG